MPEHMVDGEMTLQCLEGEIVCEAGGKNTVLQPGDMLYLLGGVPHSVRANVDSVALLTILLKNGSAESKVFNP
jgi:quercetin dioxygenase-like cupin family protein